MFHRRELKWDELPVREELISWKHARIELAIGRVSGRRAVKEVFRRHANVVDANGSHWRGSCTDWKLRRPAFSLVFLCSSYIIHSLPCSLSFSFSRKLSQALSLVFLLLPKQKPEAPSCCSLSFSLTPFSAFFFFFFFLKLFSSPLCLELPEGSSFISKETLFLTHGCFSTFCFSP